MEEAGVKPEEVTYINAHGTSTHHNDLFETRAIRKAFGDAADHVLVNSTKSMVGHLLGAAGGVEAVVCAKSIQDGFVHQTIGTKEADAECDLNYCIGAPVETDVKLAMSNSLVLAATMRCCCFRNMNKAASCSGAERKIRWN